MENIIKESVQHIFAGQQQNDHSRVVAILPRGEAIRNFVYTGALDTIARRTDVYVLSVDPGREIWGQLENRYTNVFPLEECPEHRFVRNTREILDMAHGRWLWSEAAKDRWRQRDREVSGTLDHLKRYTKKLACYPFANRMGLNLLSKAERVTSRLLRSTDEYLSLFKQLKPSVVLNGSHVHSNIAIQAVQAAQWLRIPTATFIFSWDNLTSQGRIIPSYDYYLVWNEAMRDQLLRIYRSIRPEQVFVTGTPQFDFYFNPDFYWSREEYCARIGADPARPIVLYSTGMANHMPGEPGIVERIASILRRMTNLGQPQLLVRVNPKDRTGRFEELKRRCPDALIPDIPWEPRWLTPKIDDAYLLTNTLRHVAAGINVASTISLELCMFNKPVINVGYDPPELKTRIFSYKRYYNFDHYRPVVESGAVEVAYSEDDLRRMLIEALMNPERREGERQALINQFFGESLDGKSSIRIANVIHSIVPQPLMVQQLSGRNV